MHQKKQRVNHVLAVSIMAAAFAVVPAHASNGQAATPGTGQAATAPATAPTSTPATAPAAAPAAAAKLTRADRNALTDMAMANMAEVATAKLALGKTKLPEIRGYAQRMIDDHTKAQAEVQALAKAKGVELPTELNAKYKAKSALLGALNGEIFERTYIKQAGRSDHRDTHGKLKDSMDDVKDADIKALVMKMRPVVEQHLLMADELIAKAGRDTTGTAGAATDR